VNWTVNGWLAGAVNVLGLKPAVALMAVTWMVRRARRRRGLRRSSAGLLLLLGHPGGKVGLGHRLHGEVHVRVADAAELGALPCERPDLVEFDVELVGATRDHVELVQRLGHVERVDDVR